jgi:hypothetical protein
MSVCRETTDRIARPTDRDFLLPEQKQYHHALGESDEPVISQSLSLRRIFHQEPRRNFGRRLATRVVPCPGRAANNLGCQSLVVGGVADHVHMLLQLARTIAIAGALGKIRSTSLSWINQARGLSTEFHWQAGYAVFSVSQSNVESVHQYIRRQSEHHAQQSFQDELKEWLRRYEIEWDERYVWD